MSPAVCPRVLAVETVLPAHRLTRAEVADWLHRELADDPAQQEKVLALVDSAAIEERYLAYPITRLLSSRSLTQASLDYQEAVIDLGHRAVARVLSKSGWEASSVDCLISVSCTGFMIPSLDAWLLNRLGFRPDVRRLPITELGCAAGAVALSKAREYLMAYPQARVLIVGAEVCSNTFQAQDRSMTNRVAALLFGDGAAAVAVANDDGEGPWLVDHRSHHFPDTLGVMGFDLRDGGFHIVLDRRLPDLIRHKLRPLVEGILDAQGLALRDLDSFVLHPGGRRILDVIDEALELAPQHLSEARDVLRTCGNMSSVTLFFVLQRTMQAARIAPGSWGLMGALGPGFSSEMQVIRWG